MCWVGKGCLREVLVLGSRRADMHLPSPPAPPWGRGGMRWSGAGDPEDKEQRSDSEASGQGASGEQGKGPLRTRDPYTFSVPITEPWSWDWRMWVSHIPVCLCAGGLEDRETQTWV